MSLKEYREAAEQNRTIFCRELKHEVRLFESLDRELWAIITHLNVRHDLSEPKQRIPFSFFAIVHKQFRSGFELLCRRFSHDAFAVIRIAIESIAYSYKIIDNPALADFYIERESSKSSQKEFERVFIRNLFSEGMPHKDQLKKIRDRINQTDAHPDIHYFAQCIEFENDEMRVHYFDYQNDTFILKVMEFVACYWCCIAVIREALERKDYLPLSMMSQNSSWEKLSSDLQNYLESNRQWTSQFMKE